jgi:hypothetical protein
MKRERTKRKRMIFWALTEERMIAIHGAMKMNNGVNYATR